MAFVVEKLPAPSTTRVFDSERGIRLVDKPASPEGQHQLELFLGNKKILLDVVNATKPTGMPKYNVEWKILRIYISDVSEGRIDEIKSILVDGLTTMGVYGSQEKMNSIDIDFSQAKWG